MKAKVLTAAMAALTLGMGLAACSPAHSEATAPVSPAAAASASPVASAATAAGSTAPSGSAAGDTTASAAAVSGDANASASHAKTAEGANATFNEFSATVKAETAALKSDPSFSISSLTLDKITKAYPKSLAYIDLSKFPGDKAARFISSFAGVYFVDPNGSVVSKDASNMVLSGDTATIQSNTITFAFRGTETKTTNKGGSATMTFTGDGWKFTGTTDAHA